MQVSAVNNSGKGKKVKSKTTGDKGKGKDKDKSSDGGKSKERNGGSKHSAGTAEEWCSGWYSGARIRILWNWIRLGGVLQS